MKDKKVSAHPWWKSPYICLSDYISADSIPTDVSINSKYEYINCIITDFGFNEELNYTSDSKLTCKLSFHYDYWTKTV